MAQPTRPPRDPLLTAKQLAEREGTSEASVRLMLRRGLPHYKIGGVKIRDSEFRAWLVSKRRG